MINFCYFVSLYRNGVTIRLFQFDIKREIQKYIKWTKISQNTITKYTIAIINYHHAFQ